MKPLRLPVIHRPTSKASCVKSDQNIQKISQLTNHLKRGETMISVGDKAHPFTEPLQGGNYIKWYQSEGGLYEAELYEDGQTTAACIVATKKELYEWINTHSN